MRKRTYATRLVVEYPIPPCERATSAGPRVVVFRPFNVGGVVILNVPSRLGTTNTGSTGGSTKCRTGGALAWSDAVAHEDAALADSAQSTQVEPGQTTMVGARAPIAHRVNNEHFQPKRYLHSFRTLLLPVSGVLCRDLHSFISQLNSSAFHGIGGARGCCVARGYGVLGGVRGCVGCFVCVRHGSS